MRILSAVAGRRAALNLGSMRWRTQSGPVLLPEDLIERLSSMRIRREAREKAGYVGCPNLYRLGSRRRRIRQRNMEQRGIAHWFTHHAAEYVPQVSHMLSPVRTPEDELAQVHLSGYMGRSQVARGLEHEFRHGVMIVA